MKKETKKILAIIFWIFIGLIGFSLIYITFVRKPKVYITNQIKIENELRNIEEGDLLITELGRIYWVRQKPNKEGMFYYKTPLLRDPQPAKIQYYYQYGLHIKRVVKYNDSDYCETLRKLLIEQL